MITIDGFNIKTTWGLEPMFENYYKSLKIAPSIKDRVTEDFEDEDGLKVLYSTGKVAPKDVSVSFIVDTLSQYETFINYLIAHPVVLLRDTTIASHVYRLEYISCSSYDDYKTFATFAVKFREANPKNRAE